VTDDDLRIAFAAHTAGQTHFTRRMAIVLADMADQHVRALVRRCERLGLTKAGSWDWFVANGGITREQIEEVRRSPEQGRA
jgi:hypothetical protein